MQFPGEGEEIEIVLDNSFARSYMTPCSIHRAPPTIVVRGVVVATPKWMQQHADITIFNRDTKVQNFIPLHRIISIGGVKVEQKPVVKDKVLTVYSSKTGEPYTVRMNGQTGKWSCTCTGFQFHKKCRHAVRAAEAA